MPFLRRIIILIVCMLWAVISLQAQEKSAVQFSYSNVRINTNEIMLSIKVSVKPGVQLFALYQSAPDAIASSITFDTAHSKYLAGTITESSNVKIATDSLLQSDVKYFIDSAQWQQKISLPAKDSLAIKGIISFMYMEGTEYKPGEEKIKFFIEPAADSHSIKTAAANNTSSSSSLLWIFISAFAGGLLALLTPCVYSMIPVTVSFFTKRSKTKKEGIRNALYYAISIISIFTLLGFLVTLIFGPAALNNLATNWVANLLFFALFLIFGISFLGAFEITLPSSWTNTSDSKAGTSSFMGIFFMAMTLVLVSFSCTGPIIGNLLVLAARGSYFGPLIGMFGFSLALALPFALFAFFPSKLNVLGKAGGWLNAIKVSLGFLELALAIKFLSNADLVRGWRFLDREIFISLWIVIFLLLGIYLLGKIKFHHDDELPKNDFGLPSLSVTRLFFAIAAFAFSVYMIPGLWGAPLKAISAFVPPMGTQDFIAGNPKSSTVKTSSVLPDENLPHPVNYYEAMKLYEPEVVTSFGMITYFDYDEALAVARKFKKPLMLDFTGINCVNCRKMEGQVWSNAAVMKRLKEDFVIVSLYVDVHNIDLPQKEQYFSTALNKKIETLGDKNADMQVTKFDANSQPFYFFLDGNEKKLASEGYGYDADILKFIAHLDFVKEEFKKINK